MRERGILMSDMLAIVLPSGVGLRFRDLTPTEGDKVLLAAGKTLNPDSTVAELELTEIRMGLEVMIQQVTDGPCKTKTTQVPIIGQKAEDGSQLTRSVEESDVNHPENVWKKFDPDAYEGLVQTNKDHNLLKQLYTARNRVYRGEVDAILGKAQTVAR